jgi:hypothetical protein
MTFEVSKSVRTMGAQRTEELGKKMNRIGLSLQHLLRHADEEDKSMHNGIVSEDRSWVHHYQPESNRASMQ